MPPLTWQQVAAPNYTGVSESQRLAGQLINSGFQSSIDALDKLDATQRQDQNGELLTRISSYKTADDLRNALNDGSIFQGLDRGAITSDTMDRANKQAAALLADIQTGVQTQGDRLNNAHQGLVNSQLQWTNDKTRAFEAARPAALDAVDQIRSYAAQGTAEGRAKADELTRNSAGVFAAAGWTPDQVGGLIDGTATTTKQGIGLNGDLTAQNDANIEHNENTAAKNLYTAVMVQNGNDVTAAEKAIRDSNQITPQVKAKALALTESDGSKLLQGPDTNPAAYLLQTAVENQNKGVAAPDLSKAATPDEQNAALNNHGSLSLGENKALFDSAVSLQNQAATVTDAMNVDDLYGSRALALKLVSPSVASESQADSVKKIRDSIGPNVDLKDPEIIDNINAVKDKYNMSFGQAAEVISNSLQQEPWVTQWLQGKTNVDFGRLDKLVGLIYNKNGKTEGEKMRPAMELLETARAKQNAGAKLDALQQQVKAAETRYTNLLQRAKAGTTSAQKAELSRAQLQYQALLGQLKSTISDIDSDPTIGFNANGG